MTNRGRSALGAFVQSPLGAFGKASAAPPPVLDYVVTCRESRSYAPVFPPSADSRLIYYDTGPNTGPSNCGVRRDSSFSPPNSPGQNPTYEVRFSFEYTPTGPRFPDDGAYLNWTIIGRQSGARYLVGEGTSFECENTGLDPGEKIRTYWGAIWPAQGLPLDSFRVGRELSSMYPSFEVARAGPDSLGFTEGELCDVYDGNPPPP